MERTVKARKEGVFKTLLTVLYQHKKSVIWLAILVITNLLTFMYGELHDLFEPGNEPMPTNVAFSKPAPNGSLLAMILHGSTGEFLSGDRYYLALKYAETTYVIAYELTHGQGHYEAEIEDMEWLNNTEILIRRILYDQQQDTVFHLDTHTWSEYASP